jgi:uncharacterized membrane protein
MWIAAGAIDVAINSAFSGLDRAIDATGIDKSGLLSLVVSVMSLLVTILLNAGLTRMAIHHVRTGKPDLGQMFLPSNFSWQLIGACLITYILIIVGCLLLVIPGLLALGLFVFVMPLIVDRRLGVFDAIGTSYKTLLPHLGASVFFNIRLFIVLLAGLLACCIGIIVAIPIVAVAMAILYCDFFPQGQVPAGPAAPFGPPIADPGA